MNRQKKKVKQPENKLDFRYLYKEDFEKSLLLHWRVDVELQQNHETIWYNVIKLYKNRKFGRIIE